MSAKRSGSRAAAATRETRLAIPRALPALSQAARLFGQFAVKAEECYSESDDGSLGGEFLRQRESPTDWVALALKRLVNPWLFDRHPSALGRIQSILEVFARYDAAHTPHYVRVPHPLHLALIAAEATLLPELRPVLRHWVGRAIRHRAEAERSESDHDVLTNEVLRDVTQAWVARVANLDAGNSLVVPKTLSDRIACRWLAALGPLAWACRDATSGSPVRKLVAEEEYRAVAAFYGALHLSTAVQCLTGHLILDDGLRSAFRGGLRLYDNQGIVTLIRGGPGTGKTSLAIAHASAAVLEGGCAVVLSLEETREALLSKFASVIPRVSRHDVEEWIRESYLWLWGTDGDGFSSRHELGPLVDQVPGFVSNAIKKWQEPSGRVTTDAPLCVVIDSLTAYLLVKAPHSSGKRDPSADYRENVFRVIQEWRSSKVITVLIAGADPRLAAEQAEYLADNVIVLDTQDTSRTLCLQKSRLQPTSPETHLLHVSSDGVRVFAGTAAAAKRSAERSIVPVAGESHVPIAWVDVSPAKGGQPRIRRYVQSVPEGTHISVFGVGSTRKAKYGLILLLSTPVSGSIWRTATLQRLAPNEPLELSKVSGPIETAALASSSRIAGDVYDVAETRLGHVDPSRRVHVISFLHGQDNYRAMVRGFLDRRPATSDGPGRSQLAAELVRTTVFHPGQLEPSVLVRKIERALDSRPDGRTPTGVLLDGIHNALVAFPKIARAPWVWNEIAALCAERGATLVSTYSLMSSALTSIGLDGGAAIDSGTRGHEGVLLARSSTTVTFKERNKKIYSEVPVSRDFEGLRPVALIWDPGIGGFDIDQNEWRVEYSGERKRRPVLKEPDLQTKLPFTDALASEDEPGEE